MEIIPSVLATSVEELNSLKHILGSSAERLHIDIGDGKFVPTVTVGVREIKNALGDFDLDVHLMVQNPESVVSDWLSMPHVKRIIFHLETAEHPDLMFNLIKHAHREAVLAINPDTPLDKLSFFADKADSVHFMTVQPGNYGGKFLPEVLKKIAEFHHDKPAVPIQADGGITPDNIALLRDAGVTRFVVGSYILKSQNVGKAIEELRGKL